MIRQIVLILGIGTASIVLSAPAGAEPLTEPNPLPQVDASSSSALDTIEVGDRNMNNFFPANPQGTVTNFSDPNNQNTSNGNGVGLSGGGFKLDFGDNLRSRRELDASMSPSDDGDNTKVRLLIDVSNLDDRSDKKDEEATEAPE
jgi:hypothetical protein